MVAVEAQFCGVRTVMSDRVPSEAKISDNTRSFSLESPAKEWAEEVLRERNSGNIDAEKYGEFDISTESIKLLKFYGEIIYGSEGAAAYTGQHPVLGKQK